MWPNRDGSRIHTGDTMRVGCPAVRPRPSSATGPSRAPIIAGGTERRRCRSAHQVTQAAAVVQHGGTRTRSGAEGGTDRAACSGRRRSGHGPCGCSGGSALVDSGLAALPTRPCPLPSPSGSPFRHVPTQHRLGLNAFFPARIAVVPVGGNWVRRITTARAAAAMARPNTAIRTGGAGHRRRRSSLETPKNSAKVASPDGSDEVTAEIRASTDLICDVSDGIPTMAHGAFPSES